jgi:hypothetical protein
VCHCLSTAGELAETKDTFASELVVLGLVSAIRETELTSSDDQSSLPPHFQELTYAEYRLRSCLAQCKG